MSSAHQLEAQRAIDVRCAPMGLQMNSDHLPAFGEHRQDWTKHLAGAHAAVQHDERFSSAVDLVVHFEAVHGSVAARGILVHFVSFCCSLRSQLELEARG